VLLVVLVFFWPATLRGRFLILHDSWVWSYPVRSVAWQQIHEGRIPLWTTGIFSGYPLLSMSQLGLGYPLTWVYFFHGGWGEQVYVLAPFVLAPLFTYFYTRELGRTRSAALVAGLAYTYAGFNASPISHNGMLSHGFLWLPLLLIPIERARHAPFLPCLVAASLVYALSVLSGIGQAFLTVGLVTLAYGAFVFLVPGKPLAWRSVERARPALVAGLGVALGAGVGAFQVLETVKANRLSVRRTLSYEAFTEGTKSIQRVLASIVDPLHSQVGDVTAYVPPLALVLAIVAVILALKNRQTRDQRVFFWFGTAMVAMLLMFGGSTPAYRIVHHVPLLNLFRVPGRHSAEWTLAVAVLAAYGWDHVRHRLVNRRRAGSDRLLGGVALGLACVGVVVALNWNNADSPSVTAYLVSKAALTVTVFGGVFAALSLAHETARKVLCHCLVVLATVTEGYLCISRWWFPHAKTAADLDRVSPTTAFLRRFPAHENRVYSHINGFGEEDQAYRPADAPNTTAWLGLDDLAGYEPMILSRYSEALGNAGLYGMSGRGTTPPDAGFGGPFNPRSHVLDLLNATFVVRRLHSGEAVVPAEWEQAPDVDQLVLDLGEPSARRALGRGWSGDEHVAGNSGCWTDGREAWIRAPLLPADSDYELRFSALAFHAVAPLPMIVRINGKNVSKFAVQSARQEYSLKVKRKYLDEGLNEFVFTFARTKAPADLAGGSADRRKLGMFVDFFALTPQE
jgi:hypothetical protein